MKKQVTPYLGLKKILDFKKKIKTNKKSNQSTKLIQGRKIDFFDFIC